MSLGVGVGVTRSQLMKSSISLFLLWLQGRTSPLAVLLCSSMVIYFFSGAWLLFSAIRYFLSQKVFPHLQLCIQSAPSPLPIRAWNSKGCWEKQTLPSYKKKIVLSFSPGWWTPYNFATNAIHMSVPENKDVFRNHLLVLFLDIEVAGIFSSHLSGLKKKSFPC